MPDSRGLRAWGALATSGGCRAWMDGMGGRCPPSEVSAGQAHLDNPVSLLHPGSHGSSSCSAQGTQGTRGGGDGAPVRLSHGTPPPPPRVPTGLPHCGLCARVGSSAQLRTAEGKGACRPLRPPLQARPKAPASFPSPGRTDCTRTMRSPLTVKPKPCWSFWMMTQRWTRPAGSNAQGWPGPWGSLCVCVQRNGPPGIPPPNLGTGLPTP